MKTTRQKFLELQTLMQAYAQILNRLKPSYRPPVKINIQDKYELPNINETEYIFDLEATNGNNDVLVQIKFRECTDSPNKLEISYTEYSPMGDRVKDMFTMYKQDRYQNFIQLMDSVKHSFITQEKQISHLEINKKLNSFFDLFIYNYTKQYHRKGA